MVTRVDRHLFRHGPVRKERFEDLKLSHPKTSYDIAAQNTKKCTSIKYGLVSGYQAASQQIYILVGTGGNQEQIQYTRYSTQSSLDKIYKVYKDTKCTGRDHWYL